MSIYTLSKEETKQFIEDYGYHPIDSPTPKELKEEGCEKRSGFNSPNPGGYKLTEETKERMRKKKTKSHCLNISKGRRGIVFSQDHINNIREATTGIKQSKETKEKRRKTISTLKWWNNGLTNIRSVSPPDTNWEAGRCGKFTQNTIKECPHCGKIGKGGAMSQWHFDNCKHRDVNSSPL